jgi:hypothetical protein
MKVRVVIGIIVTLLAFDVLDWGIGGFGCGRGRRRSRARDRASQTMQAASSSRQSFCLS